MKTNKPILKAIESELGTGWLVDPCWARGADTYGIRVRRGEFVAVVTSILKPGLRSWRQVCPTDERNGKQARTEEGAINYGGLGWMRRLTTDICGAYELHMEGLAQ